MASSELIQTLEEIARIKESLPSRARGWCSDLGLYVQMREMRGMSSLKAGGKFRSQIELWRESPRDSWQVKKYRSGKWEALAEPTLKLAKWLVPRGGIADTAECEFRHAVSAFHRTGRLFLPEGMAFFTEESHLGSIIHMHSGRSRKVDTTMSDDELMELRSYIHINPDHAAAWQALGRLYRNRRSFGASLAAINRALELVPYEAEFHIEAASIYSN